MCVDIYGKSLAIFIANHFAIFMATNTQKLLKILITFINSKYID